jgi:hypothetical protein
MVDYPHAHCVEKRNTLPTPTHNALRPPGLVVLDVIKQKYAIAPGMLGYSFVSQLAIHAVGTAQGPGMCGI